jgi:hypothetical protein
MRMKEHMISHVSSNLDMFAESCEEVKKRLIDMCGQVCFKHLFSRCHVSRDQDMFNYFNLFGSFATTVTKFRA